MAEAISSTAKSAPASRREASGAGHSDAEGGVAGLSAGVLRFAGLEPFYDDGVGALLDGLLDLAGLVLREANETEEGGGSAAGGRSGEAQRCGLDAAGSFDAVGEFAHGCWLLVL
jgi:hypothetical protein